MEKADPSDYNWLFTFQIKNLPSKERGRQQQVASDLTVEVTYPAKSLALQSMQSSAGRKETHLSQDKGYGQKESLHE